MGNRYVDVTISRLTKAVTKRGFGVPLILSTDGVTAYKEYKDIEALLVDHAETTETYKVAAAMFRQKPGPGLVAVYGVLYDSVTDVPADLALELDELVKTHNDFFYVTSTEQGDAEITELSNWTHTQKKMYFASTDSVALPLTMAANENTFILVHDQPQTYPAEALAGQLSALETGSFTATFKQLVGIEPAAYDDATIDQIEANNASTYIREGGYNIVSKGITTGGEYVDVIQGQYYLEASIVSNVFGMLANTPKVPFSYGGIAMSVAALEKSLKEASNMGILLKDADGKSLYSITTPNLEDISANDRANRNLPNIPWSATIEGSIESIGINGVLQV